MVGRFFAIAPFPRLGGIAKCSRGQRIRGIHLSDYNTRMGKALMEKQEFDMWALLHGLGGEKEVCPIEQEGVSQILMCDFNAG